MDNNSYVPTPWNDQPPTVYRSGDTLKTKLPGYLNRIQKHYESSPAPRTRLTELSPFDLHRKWGSGIPQYQEWSSVIMDVAPSVVSVSIFTGVQRKIDCTGLVIKWDDSTSKATVITSAKLARLPDDEDHNDYYIVVRTPNGKILLAEEHYVDYYHNIMTLKVSSDVILEHVELSSSPLEELEGTEVVALMRDFVTCNLSETSGVMHKDYPYFGCEQLVSSTCAGYKAGEGGPLLTRMGDVCGINFFDGHKSVHPLPTSVIRSFLDSWNSHRIVVQPWFGFTVIDATELPYDAMETITIGCCGPSTGTTAVIKQVYKGSPADEAGVCPGDLVVNLEHISIYSAAQYSQALSTISDNLSASCTRRTLDSTRNIQVLIHAKDCHDGKVVVAKNLTVDDKRFCCSWPDDEDDWYRDPLFGSQTDYAYDMGVNNNAPSWLRDCVTSSI